MPLSAELQNLVCGPFFSIGTQAHRDDVAMWICATGVALHLDLDVEEAVAQLGQLVELDLIREVPGRTDEGAPCYKPNPALWRIREETFRLRGQRSRVVVRSHAFALPDVVLALIVGGGRANADVPAGFIAGPPDILVDELDLVLFDRTTDEIAKAIAELEERSLVSRGRRPLARGRMADEDVVRATIRGRSEYKRQVASRLGLTQDENPYQVGAPQDFVIFYIWQSHEKRSRNHICEALVRLVKEANEDWKCVRPVRYETGVEIGDGAVPINLNILRRIRAASVVIADFTPIGVFCQARCPNPNVLVEVGYALENKDPSAVWLVEWAGDGLPTGVTPFPFDVHGISRMRYEQPKELRSRLREELRTALDRLGWLPAEA